MMKVEVFRQVVGTTCPSIDEALEHIAISINPAHYHGIGSLEIPEDLKWFNPETDVLWDGTVLVAASHGGGPWEFVSEEIEDFFKANCPGWLV